MFIFADGVIFVFKNLEVKLGRGHIFEGGSFSGEYGNSLVSLGALLLVILSIVSLKLGVHVCAHTH